MSWREPVQLVAALAGSFGLGGILGAFVTYWLTGGRLRVTASIEPEDQLQSPFPHGIFVKLRIVNVGRRPMKVTEVGALLRKSPPPMHEAVLVDRAKTGSKEFLKKDFKASDLQPDEVLEEDVIWFGLFHENFRRFFVQDVQGRRFFVSRRNFKRLRSVRRQWEKQHPTQS